MVQRRHDLTQMLVAKTNRTKAPCAAVIKSSCQKMIRALKEQLAKIIDNIKKLINSDKILREKQKLLQTISGIEEIVSFELLILLPELGTLNRRKIASLAGLAPISNKQLNISRIQGTGHGRNGVKQKLFLAAMAARNSKSELKDFYEKLISKR